MMRYSFTITLEGEGNTPEQAWEDATLSLALYSMDMPDKYDEIESEE